MYRDTRIRPKTCTRADSYRQAKTAPWRLVAPTFTYFIAGTLGVIAQKICAPNNTMITSLYTDNFVTMDCSLSHLVEKENYNDCRLAPKSNLAHILRFASLYFCHHNYDCQAQLTSNTDNKINRFVTFFALILSHLDSFVKQVKSRPLHCFL